MTESTDNYPRITIAGTSSGVGKTTITLAIMAALAQRGLTVQGFKVGPDFIDPGYYKMVTGRWGRNLDTWMIGKENSLACFHNSAVSAGISVIEGVMGLFDGKAESGEGSTAEAAKLTRSPVILTINCAKMGASAGAIALGFTKYDQELDIKGFILNNIGSDRHESMVKRAVENATGLPVLGCVKRNDEVKIPERHLGLVTHIETREQNSYSTVLARLAETYIDIDGILEIAKEAEGFDAHETGLKLSGFNTTIFTSNNVEDKVKIGVAYDKAFSFYYHDNFDLLRANGAELVFFSPLEDKHIPEGVNGLYLGGGYPEVYAKELAVNSSIASEVRAAVESGLPVYAECGGLIYLSLMIEDFNARNYNMSGALPVKCKMQNRPTLGYREVTAQADSVIAPSGELLRGHEFHYSSIIKVSNGLNAAYKTMNGDDEGFIYKNTLASYVHMHFAGRPEIARRFVEKCSERLG